MTFNDVVLKQELVDRWNLLQSMPQYAGKLARPFSGYAPTTFSEATNRILYIGKATAGPFEGLDASKDNFGCNKGMFWSFARRLGSKTGNVRDPLGNIAWSNLCKIGTILRNPGPALTEAQREISVKILKAEISFLSPSLIVCVASNSPYDDFLYESLNTTRGSDGFIGKKYGKATLHLRYGLLPYPPVLWMHHPQGKSKGYLDFAEAQALQLLAIG